MSTLDELMARDDVTATWFWVTSHSVGFHEEEEEFDVVFTIDTDYVIGGGYHQRRTMYVQGVFTHRSQSRREHGGNIVNGDPVEVLASLLMDASGIDANPTFEEWAREYYAGGDTPAWTQYATFENSTRTRNRIKTWLGDHYDEYVQAASNY